jgi:ubiquinone/menaquinone biosynthesis C-methylase UbiE
VSALSAFSAVDDAAEPGRLIQFLEESAVGLAAMKYYMAAAHAIRQPSAPVLDVGCGAGHDLSLLDALGIRAVGIDASSVMVDEARRRISVPLARADASNLPFSDASFAGARIERVLMHVADPAAVLCEVVRCVQPGGLLTVFEPDWASLTVCGTRVPVEWLSLARHPAIGASVGALATRAGCSILDRVEERSWWVFEDFMRITNAEPSLERAVARGVLSRSEAAEWLAGIRRRAFDGTFDAEMTKILWVARVSVPQVGAG